MDEFRYYIYGKCKEEDDLSQGDILQPTQELRSIFENIHPHFIDEKYTAFLVLTQTCDLVRRNRERPSDCKSRYINLAVVRPLLDILTFLLDRTCGKVEISGKVASRIYTKESKQKAKQLLERIFNQNEQAMGIFYLPEETSVKIADPSVALLQVSVAVRAHPHYEALRKSRSGRLKPEFQSKLGWLVGTLFSRVATQDMPKEKQKELMISMLGSEKKGEESDIGLQWISEKNVKAASKQKITIDNLTTNQIVDTLEKCKPTSPFDIAIERIIFVIEEILEGITKEKLRKIKNRLINDPHFRSSCKK